jgi:predicted amidohydrolase YtcJ
MAPGRGALSRRRRFTSPRSASAYTRGGAYAAAHDEKVGTLEPGKAADLIVLSQDVFQVAPGEIAKTRVMATMVGGKVVYGKW